MKSLLHEQGRGLDIGKKISKGLTDGADLIVQKKRYISLLAFEAGKRKYRKI